MKLPTIRSGLAGKNVKKRPLSEPVRLQDLENSARSLTKKKISLFMVRVMFRKLKQLTIILSGCSHFARVFNSRFLAFPKQLRYYIIVQPLLALYKLLMFPLLTNQKLHYYSFCTATYDCQKVDIMSHLKTFFKVAPQGF